MMFFPGMHKPQHAHRLRRSMISANTLRTRKSDFAVGDWIMDSGAFTTIAKHGGYPEGVEAYAAVIRRWHVCGRMLAAVAQDFMCEPHMLKITGKSLEEHQRLTIERFDDLIACELAGAYVMPVLQGYAPDDYRRHLEAYGDRLAPGAWVGVGSVCKRNGRPDSVAAVIHAITDERPDLRLHGFGLKATALFEGAIRDALYSADSFAWSYSARRNGRNANDWREALAYTARIDAQVVQMGFLC